jgi:hypothetical protein
MSDTTNDLEKVSVDPQNTTQEAQEALNKILKNTGSEFDKGFKDFVEFGRQVHYVDQNGIKHIPYETVSLNA